MDMQTEKLNFIQWLVNVKDSKVINELVEWQKSKSRISVEEYNTELELADHEIEKGNFMSHQEAKDEISSWREK